MFRFANTELLYLLVLVPLLGIFFIYAARQRRRALNRFGSKELVEKLSSSVSRSRRAWKEFLLLITLTLLIITLARPQLGTRLLNVKREGQDIIIALDVSASMLAEDIKPNRLEKAKHEISTLIDRLEGDRVGLVAFAGRAFVQCPLTLDYGAARMFLAALTPDIIPVPGTALALAIQTSAAAFEEKERKHKILILITDGEDHEGEPLKAAQEAAKQGVIVYTVGLGSPEGVPIPVIDATGNRSGFKKDEQGQVVMTKLDEVTLEKIALETGGKYYRASPGEVELGKIYDDISAMEKKNLASRQFAQFEDRFQFLLGLALLLLMVELFLPERRRMDKTWKGRFLK